MNEVTAQEESVRFPNISVKLIGQDSSAETIVETCKTAMRDAKCRKRDIEAFEKEATSGTYNHLLATCMRYFEVE